MSLRTLSRVRDVVVCVAARRGNAGVPVAASRRINETFASPEDAAKALIEVAKGGKLDDLMKLLGPRRSRWSMRPIRKRRASTVKSSSSRPPRAGGSPTTGPTAACSSSATSRGRFPCRS